jgi:hypothetical protein
MRGQLLETDRTPEARYLEIKVQNTALVRIKSPTGTEWYGLDWTDWIPLRRGDELRSALPSGPGVYRVRLTSVGAAAAEQLAYIGQSGRVQRRLASDLRRPVLGSEMPWNDPHTAAPALWAYCVENGAEPCVSAASAPEDTAQRRGLEDALLWHHRQASGRSTLCNYGRFHPQYRRPGNKDSGREMKRLEEPTPEANGPCADPLPLEGKPTGGDWMSLGWSTPASLTTETAGKQPTGPGIYRIFRLGAGSLMYVGETSSLRRRLRSHSRREWRLGAQVSVATVGESASDYQRKEIESDLLGGHFEQTGVPPKHQYGNLPS